MSTYQLSHTASAIDAALTAVVQRQAQWDAKIGASDTARRAASIPYGEVDDTSTSTAFTATVPGITSLEAGTCVVLKNGVVTSAAGFTIDINGLGAHHVFSSMTPATDIATVFNVNYTMMFIYRPDVTMSGVQGAWMCYYGYNTNTNTIGYQLRTNVSTKPMKDITYRYRLLFTSADGLGWVPANTSTSTNATAKRNVNQTPIDPFGEIVYYQTTAAVAVGEKPAEAYLWQQYSFALGYSFNRTGAALALTVDAPVYVKCAPQSDGSAIIDADTPYVQALPTAEDGKIYIYLGMAVAAATVEMTMKHPVYYFKDGAMRLWTNAPASGGGGIPHLSCDSSTPITDTATVARFSAMLDEASQNGYSSVDPFAWFTFSRWSGSGWTNVTSAVCQSGGVQFDPPSGDWYLQLNGNQLELIYND